jgi:hypothetical protein
VPRQVDEQQVGPGALEAVDRVGAAVDRAVVDDPEHALGGRVRFGGHDLGNERIERLVADFGHTVAEQPALRVVDIQRGQIRQCPAAAVFVLDQPRASGTRGDERVASEQRLQLRLLVGRDHVLAGMQPPARPATLVEIEHPAGLLPEVRIAGEYHERHAHGRIASSLSQRHTVVPETRQTIPRATASRASSAPDQRDSGRPVWAGSSQASALTSAISAGGKRPRPTRPRPLV